MPLEWNEIGWLKINKFRVSQVRGTRDILSSSLRSLTSSTYHELKIKSRTSYILQELMNHFVNSSGKE